MFEVAYIMFSWHFDIGLNSEMARRGLHYDRTAVAHALIDPVKGGVLNREGRPRRYQYVQKRPPSSR